MDRSHYRPELATEERTGGKEGEHHPYTRTVKANTHHVAAGDRGSMDPHSRFLENRSQYQDLTEERLKGSS
jgi:hypothetical protein